MLWQLQMNKRNKIIGIFFLYSGLLYLLMTFLTKEEINKHTGDSVIHNLAIGVFYSTTGILIYLLIINLTAIIGLLATWIRKDRVGLMSFKILSILTISGTLIFYLINSLL
jgi:hypothetical protein